MKSLSERQKVLKSKIDFLKSLLWKKSTIKKLKQIDLLYNYYFEICQNLWIYLKYVWKLKKKKLNLFSILNLTDLTNI